jgi:hypothetical protein
MAMSLSLSPASDALPQQGGVDNSNSSSSLSVLNNSTSNNSSTTTSPIDDHSAGHLQIAPSSGPKRKPSRRANTAERRATHNAVERQRRETLNGRFLDLAALLPNLSQIRRPSKSSIVNSSIAHIQASRRHRLIASRELKMLKLEADALRREVNEWRDRSGLPRVDEPPRGDGFAMVITGELEVIQCVPIEEEDEEGDDGFGIGQSMGPIPGMPHPQQVQAYNAPYMDDVDEDFAMLMYAQQQQQQQQTGEIHSVQLASQRQVHFQHPMMASQPHELEDPRASMLLKNATHFALNNSQSLAPSAGYPTVNSRSPTYANGAANWVPSQVAGFATSPTSHGLPGNTSSSGSPVGGVSANGNNTGSPASTTSSLSSFGGGSPLSMVPSHNGFRRERSGSLTGSSPGSHSPAYELHTTHAAMQEFPGVPRIAGMCGASYVPSHHHMHGQGHGMQIQPQAMAVGGGANAMMMMMV